MDAQKMGPFIVLLIQTVVFVAPVLTLFYKQGRKDQILDEVIKDVNGLGKKVSELKDIQTEVLTELKNNISGIEQTLVRVTTSMEYITKQIEELKQIKAKTNMKE